MGVCSRASKLGDCDRWRKRGKEKKSEDEAGNKWKKRGTKGSKREKRNIG